MKIASYVLQSHCLQCGRQGGAAFVFCGDCKRACHVRRIRARRPVPADAWWSASGKSEEVAAP